MVTFTAPSWPTVMVTCSWAEQPSAPVAVTVQVVVVPAVARGDGVEVFVSQVAGDQA